MDWYSEDAASGGVYPCEGVRNQRANKVIRVMAAQKFTSG
jgi:hypothetical protein